MRFTIGGAGAAALVLLTLGGCVSTEFAAINTEPGFYYGFGSGSTEPAAQAAAYDDLVYNTLSESGSIKKDRKAKASLSPEMKASLAALAPKPYLSENKKTSFTAAYRVKIVDWQKAETLRLAQLAKDLGGKYTALGADDTRTLGARFVEAVKLLAAIDRQGVPLSLRVGGAETPLLADAVVQWCRDQMAGAAFRFQPETGLVNAGQPVAITLTNKAGKALSGLPLTLVWSTDATSLPPLTLVTDSKGTVSAPYPAAETFKNVKSSVKVTSRIGTLAPEAAFLAGFDGGLKGEAAYRNVVVLAGIKTPEVRVEGGTFTVGAVPQDRKAGSKEKPRTVTVAPFWIDVAPVTNAQYQSYLQALDLPKDQWPDFLIGGDLGGPDQPVVGVTYDDAVKYAAWLSGVTGVTKRLPTEDEYEVAARAGQSTIFPWGDQPATDGPLANYSGNKKFASTSPVGAFGLGKNPLGLVDMVGNVWEWTSTGPGTTMTADPAFKVVKGGSWLDGPNELRISNRKAVDPAEGTSDIGFRLVREDK